MKSKLKLLIVIPLLILGYFTYVGLKTTFIKTKQYLVNSALEEQGYKLKIEEKTIVSTLDSIEEVIADKEIELQKIDYQQYKLSNNEQQKNFHAKVKPNRLGIKHPFNATAPSDCLITRWSTRPKID